MIRSSYLGYAGGLLLLAWGAGCGSNPGDSSSSSSGAHPSSSATSGAGAGTNATGSCGTGGGSSSTGAGGALSPSALTAWANDGGDKVTRDEQRASSKAEVRNSVWDGTTIKLFAA